MKLVRFVIPGQGPRLGQVREGAVRDLTASGVPALGSLDALLRASLETPIETLKADLAAEEEAAALYREARAYCQSVSDFVSMELFQELLTDEEGHIDFLETQIALHDRLGEERYALLNAASMDAAE